MEFEVIKATAEAVKSSAEAAKATIDFVSFLTKEPLKELSDILRDNFAFYKWRNRQALILKATAIMKERGLDKPTRALPFKEIIPLIEYSSLEDDDYLQNWWAELLVNSADQNTSQKNNLVFIELLKSISPIEAKILEAIYALPEDGVRYSGIGTKYLPDSASLRRDTFNEDGPRLSDEITIAISNLDRLRCLSISTAMDGNQLLGEVHPTALGRKFVEACSLSMIKSY